MLRGRNEESRNEQTLFKYSLCIELVNVEALQKLDRSITDAQHCISIIS